MIQEEAPGIALVEPVGGHGGMDYYDSGLAAAVVARGTRCAWYSCEASRVHGARPVTLRTTFTGVWGDSPAPLRAWRFVRGLLATLRDARRESLAVAHLQFFDAGPLELLTVLAARAAGMACVATVHDVEPLAGGGGGPRWLPRLVYCGCRTLVVHNRASAQALRERVPSIAARIEIVPHGSYVGLVAPRAPRESSRRALGLPADAPVLLFFGQIKAVKGLDLLIEAVARSRAALSGLTLVVAGKVWKDDLARYERQIAEAALGASVRLHVRYIPDAELPLFYGAADLVVLPYRRIYQSGVLIMAMTQGVPVLVSDLPGMREIVDDGRNGFVFRTGDAADLARAIARVLADPAARTAAAAAALQDLQERYAWDTLAPRLIEIYRRAASPRQP